MTSPSDKKDAEQAEPSNPQDLATAYRELVKGEQSATQLEAKLTNLESKLDAMLAAFEQQGQGQGRQQQQQQGSGSSGADANGSSKKE